MLFTPFSCPKESEPQRCAIRKKWSQPGNCSASLLKTTVAAIYSQSSQNLSKHINEAV
jgi:hypothetical protein